MILRGAQIHRDERGKCGLLPNPTFSSNTAQLPSSDALANTRMIRGDSVVSSSPLQTGRYACVRL